MERSAQEAVPRVIVHTRNNFQLRFVLDKIFNMYKDRQYVRKKSVIELGTSLMANGVLNIEPLEWELLKSKSKIEIFSKLLNDSSSVHHTFKTRDVCMEWVNGISPPDYMNCLEKEIEFVFTSLCDKKSSYRVSEKWCQENNLKTEDNPEVLERICKPMRLTDKNSLITDLQHELQQRAKEDLYLRSKEDWMTALTTLKDPRDITWNPLLFDLCATKYNIAVSVIANMTLPGSRDKLPVICECRIYPKRDMQKDISHVTFIRKNYEKYIYVVAEVAPVGLCSILDILDKTLGTKETKLKEGHLEIDLHFKEIKEFLLQVDTRQCKLIFENEDLHESLQKIEINNNKLFEEREGLLLQLKSKSQKQVDEVTALQENVELLTRENEKLRHNNKRLITQNTNLKSTLEMYKKQTEEQERKIKEQNHKIAQQDEKLREQGKKIAQQSDEIKNQSKRIKGQEERISNLEHKIGRNGSSSSTRHIDVKSESSGSVKSVTHK